MPATCWAASSPATSPTSASTSTSGWSARRSRSSAATTPSPSPRCGSSCRSTRTCRPTTSSRSGCGWRCTSGWPRCATEADVKGVEAELHDRYGAPPAEVLNLLEVARFRLLARSAGLHRDRRPGHLHPLRARPTCRSPGVSGCSGSTRAAWSRTRRRTILVPRPASATIGGPAVKDLACCTGASKVITDDLLVEGPRHGRCRRITGGSYDEVRVVHGIPGSPSSAAGCGRGPRSDGAGGRWWSTAGGLFAGARARAWSRTWGTQDHPAPVGRRRRGRRQHPRGRPAGLPRGGGQRDDPWRRSPTASPRTTRS